jgi:hypothetical protein
VAGRRRCRDPRHHRRAGAAFATLSLRA